MRPAAGVHRSQTRQTEALIEQLAVKRRYVLLEVLHRLPVVPQAAVDIPQVVLRHDCHANIPQSRANFQGALASREGVVCDRPRCVKWLSR